jgi:hypothetical protein
VERSQRIDLSTTCALEPETDPVREESSFHGDFQGERQPGYLVDAALPYLI